MPTKRGATLLAAGLVVGLLTGCQQGKVSGGGTEGEPKRDAGFGLPPATDASGVEDPSCATEIHKAELGGADILFLVDIGPTMGEPFDGQRNKFVAVKDALLDFVMDPRSAHLGVGLQFVPYGFIDKSCDDVHDCGREQVVATPGAGPGTLDPCFKMGFCFRMDMPDTIAMCGPNKCVCGLAACPMGTFCRAAGNCATSHAECFNAGQTCAGGAADGVCQVPQGMCIFTGPSCEVGMYGKLAVPFVDLPKGADTFLRGLNLGMDSQMGIWTPLPQALKGTLAALEKGAATPGARRSALVVVTAASPMLLNPDYKCDPMDPLVALPDLQAAAKASPAISTYFVGVLSPAERTTGQAILQQLASAGGTGQPFLLDPNQDVTTKLHDSLAGIRKATLACDFAIPDPQGPTPIDYGKVNVTLRSGGKAASFVYVGTADRCTAPGAAPGGWYYDVDPAKGKPGRVLLCPSACDAAKSDPMATLELAFGCKRNEIK
jgi:hypothetical protein